LIISLSIFIRIYTGFVDDDTILLSNNKFWRESLITIKYRPRYMSTDGEF